MSDWIELIMMFLSVSISSFVTLQWFRNRKTNLEQRRLAAQQQDTEEPDLELPLGRMTPVLAAQVPITEDTQKELRGELREAGYYSPDAVMVYGAVRSLLVIVPLLIAVLVGVIIPRNLIPTAYGAGFVLAAIGFAFPRAYIHQVARTRKRQIERGLPVVVDMLALAITAGQTSSSALERVAQEIQTSFPELAKELEIIRHHTQLRSLDFALQDWADRVRIPEVHQLVAVLSSSERLGKDVSAGLLEFSEHYRTTQRQRADEQANRASVLMLFPMLFGLWLPAATILVAPILFEFHDRGQDAIKEIKKGTAIREQQMDRLNQMRKGNNPGPDGVQKQ